MLNVNRLAVLHAVVTRGSVTAAAEQLSYTPSAVSQHIAALEREVGISLLERIGRRVRPTPAGTLLAEHAAAILDRVREAEAAVAALAEGRTGRLRLTAFGSAGISLVPPAVAEFRARHPQCDLQLSIGELPEVQAALRDDEADLGVVIFDIDSSGAETRPLPAGDGMVWVPLIAEPYFVILPAEHRLAGLTAVPLSALASERLVSGDRNPLCVCGAAFRRICGEAGFAPEFAIEVGDYPAVQSLVAAGVGPAAVPLLGLSPAVHERIVVRPLVEPALTRRIYAVSGAGREGDPLIAAMLTALRRAADTLPIPAAVPARATYSADLHGAAA